MEIKKYRKKIDKIDRKIADLFAKRMKCSGEIGKFKKENGIKITDGNREAEVVANVRSAAGEYADHAEELYMKIFEISKKYQGETEKK